MKTQSITLTLSADECLSVRMALNMTACEWADKSLEHIQAGENDDAATCQRLRAKYHALWERVHAAQRLAEAEARADDMFASEARETADDCEFLPDDVRSWDANASRFPANRRD